jgi:hypothetical protein
MVLLILCIKSDKLSAGRQTMVRSFKVNNLPF